MKIPFVKMEGAGNDYVYIDLIKNYHQPGSNDPDYKVFDCKELDSKNPDCKGLDYKDTDYKNSDFKGLDYKDLDYKDLAKKISQRHFGVGSDGLVLILPSSRASCKMRMFNADGTEAEMCGNAIRCVAKYVYDHGYYKKKQLEVDTLAGLKNVWIVKEEADHKASGVRVDMGEPVLSGKAIPVNIDKEPVVDVSVMGYTGTAVSMGNPHLVIFTDDITDEQVLQHGPRIEKDPLFPNRTNVEFVKIVRRDLIDMRVWERGSGETLACGTGACASVVAGVLNGSTSRRVDVRLTGGVLRIEWNEKDNRVYLTGPAREVFYGFYHYR